MASGKRDQNRIAVAMGVSSVDGITPLAIEISTVTGRLLCIYTAASSGENATPVARAHRDGNYMTTIMGESNDTNRTPTPLTISSNTNGLMVKGN